MGVVEIVKSKILAVEGKDEENFFEALFKYLEIYEVQILNFGGKTNFSSRINVLPKIPGFGNVTKIGFIRDADNNEPRSAFDSIVYALKKAEFDPPTEICIFNKSNPAIGIFIMPDNLHKGMLEDLCLRYIKDLPVIDCIDDYFFCLDGFPLEISKAMIQVYLAGKSPLVSSLGLGALNKHFDFSSKHFKGLIEFILNFK